MQIPASNSDVNQSKFSQCIQLFTIGIRELHNSILRIFSKIVLVNIFSLSYEFKLPFQMYVWKRATILFKMNKTNLIGNLPERRS